MYEHRVDTVNRVWVNVHEWGHLVRLQDRIEPSPLGSIRHFA